MENIISADMSLDGSFPASSKGGKSILIGAAYDYFFKKNLLFNEGKIKNKSKDFIYYQYLFAGSPFVRRTLEQCYTLQDNAAIFERCTPFAADLCKKDKREKINKKTREKYPILNGRKILAIITVGESEKKKQDMGQLLEKYGRDWCLVTNDFTIVESLSGKYSEMRMPVVYSGKYVQTRLLLYLADILVTNFGYFAASFSATGKPFFAIDHNGSGFEQYMEKMYPDLYLKNIEDVFSAFNNPNMRKLHHELCEDLSYPYITQPEYEVMQLIYK
ncbi:MAG: hypothetical protein IJI25_04510 [Eubacterium sp.]|nr:hypothetical protein [Eubacterium sp.]